MKRSSMFTRLCLLGALLAPWGVAAAASQTLTSVEAIDFDRPEAWGMKYFTSATLMSGFSTARPLRFGQLRVALEGAWVPFVSDEQRIIGFNGTKSEDLNRLPVLGRLELTIGLPWLLSFTVGIVPPIPINGVQADLFSMALARPIALTRDFTIGVALYGQTGFVSGPFTCSTSEAAAGSDPQRNPLGCLQKSHDELGMNYFGFELSASYRIVSAHGLEPYVSAAVNYMNLGFSVNARYGEVVDRTRLTTQGTTFSTTAGLLFPITPRLDVVGETFYSPLWVQRPQHASNSVEGLFNVRALIAYRFF